MKTFKEIAIEQLLSTGVTDPQNNIVMKGVISLMVKSMKIVRKQTLIECANMYEFQYNQHILLSLNKNSLNV